MIEIPGVITFGAVYSLDQARTERHAEIIESLSWSKGRHLVTAGASLHRISWDGRLANRFHGLYLFPTLSAFTSASPDVYIQAFGDPRTQINTTPAGFWLQDHWQLTPSLSLEAGLRYDRQWLPHPFPSPNGNIAPRLGIAWHPTASSSWVFRAGAGLFYDRYPLEYLNLAIQKDGQHRFEQYFVGNLATQIYQSTAAGALSQPLPAFPISTYSPAPGFTSTYSRKLTAGLERKLDRDTTFTAEFSDVNGLHLPRLRNANLTLPPQYYLEQTAFSTYRGFSLSVNRRLRNEFTYLASYSIGTTQDDSSDYTSNP
ncbi:MAG: TonB-dependent receptor [Bryobacterales bacterium]|nr:TonB-dependent receptor [Bryobacterales bacterium]